MKDINTNFDVERIDNGWLVTNGIGDEQSRMYYEDIKQIISALTTELEAQVKEARHYDWPGKFKIILKAHDIGSTCGTKGH